MCAFRDLIGNRSVALTVSVPFACSLPPCERKRWSTAGWSSMCDCFHVIKVSPAQGLALCDTFLWERRFQLERHSPATRRSRVRSLSHFLVVSRNVNDSLGRTLACHFKFILQPSCSCALHPESKYRVATAISGDSSSDSCFNRTANRTLASCLLLGTAYADCLFRTTHPSRYTLARNTEAREETC